MQKAETLPSGNARVRVYSHTDEHGKKIYRPFTAPTKREAQRLAAEFIANRKKETQRTLNISLGEAMDQYIELSEPVLSPTTIHGYKRIRKTNFQSLMNVKLVDITENMLQRAINEETQRKARSRPTGDGTLSPKTVKNAFGLVSATLKKYRKEFIYDVTLPTVEIRSAELLPPEIIYEIVKGTEIELPALLSMWLSFSLSELRGLTKSKSIIGGKYLRIKDVVVDVAGKTITKGVPKAKKRNRYLEIPEYIMGLIESTPSDQLITLSGHAIYCRWVRLLEKNDLPHMTFHDLRHVNASVMSLLNIPEKYALERGGWKTPAVMKNIYQSTFDAGRVQADSIMDNYFNRIVGLEKKEEKAN